jgi:hypothetical protein
MKQTTYLATLPQVNALIEQGFEPASDIGPVKRTWQCLTLPGPASLAFTKHATWRNKIGLHDEAQRFVEEPENGCGGSLCSGCDFSGDGTDTLSDTVRPPAAATVDSNLPGK